MSARQRDAPERVPPYSAFAARRTAGAPTGRAGALLALQRQAGNRAVAGMFGEAVRLTEVGDQRCGGHDCDECGETQDLDSVQQGFAANPLPQLVGAPGNVVQRRLIDNDVPVLDLPMSPEETSPMKSSSVAYETVPEGGVAKGSGYYPDQSKLEGGFVDRLGKPLRTLQDYLAGRAPYVSVAMDRSVFPYGTVLHISEISDHYGKDIEFRVVDTGDAFKGKGKKRMDICVANYRASLDPLINGTLHYGVKR